MMLHSKRNMQQCGKLTLLTFLVMFGCINAVPFYENNFETVDTDFVPLENQHFQARTQAPPTKEKPFDIDVISGEINENHSPNVFGQQSFPFFGPDFFNSFGGFGFGPQQEPWWKGPNVCTDKEETVKDTEADKENSKPSQEELVPGISESIDIKPIIGQFHFSLHSCVDKPNKYVCSRSFNQNGKMKTVVITRQCCHGYGRPRDAGYSTPCDKIDIKNVADTAANMGAKEFIDIAKANGLADQLLTNRKNITIFMPIDSAFTNYNEDQQNENNLVEKSGEVLKKLYLRHIVDGEYDMDNVANEQILKTQMEGQTIRINMYQLPLSLGPVHYTANCIPIEKHDKLSEQGLVHTISGVMKPVTANVMDIIRSRADLSIMRTVLEKTKISEILESDKPVTIFVPTDDAFDKLEPHLRRTLKEGKKCAANILKNHILDLTFCSAASIAGAKTSAFNLLGEPLRFNKSKSAQEKSEVADLVNESYITINNAAKIIEPDVMGTNGVLHIVDTILSTESALPLSTLMQTKNVTLFKRLVEAAELDNKIDDMDNITLFAPTDKALQGTKWVEMLTETPEKLRNNPELVDFINYHIVHPMTKTCDLTEQLMPTAAGSSIRINLYSTHALFTNVMNRATVNCARVVHFDDESCGSVLHQVDKPLTPPNMNLLEYLEKNPRYSKFLELVRSSNLTSLLTNKEETYTLFLPNNDVFEEVEDWEKTLIKDKSQLESLVKTHIVNDAVCCAGIMPTNWPFVRSIEALNGAHLRITRERRPKVENAGITKCDAVAVNGIVHEINDIIVPARRSQRPQQNVFQQNIGSDFGDLFF
ncbi:transforming growth factor-beta-induced protein ig-h3 isoform X2 [Teleopsis dalmanni]|uniref:transforming growth factor-beta-induced protein ig-h3 isoform X2 n=1 Tax=Teleopsis dalmanni TaxID=139649 RepID=UPI0018CF608A|nr:transforming growth factor-beta-induced protein ig-h3 isoform X2 [Teleopsis dalmanni]